MLAPGASIRDEQKSRKVVHFHPKVIMLYASTQVHFNVGDCSSFNVGDCSSFRISISSENPTKIALAGSVRAHNGSVHFPSTICDLIRQKTLGRIFGIPGPLPPLAIQC